MSTDVKVQVGYWQWVQLLRYHQRHSQPLLLPMYSASTKKKYFHHHFRIVNYYDVMGGRCSVSLCSSRTPWMLQTWKLVPKSLKNREADQGVIPCDSVAHQLQSLFHKICDDGQNSICRLPLHLNLVPIHLDNKLIHRMNGCHPHQNWQHQWSQRWLPPQITCHRAWCSWQH